MRYLSLHSPSLYLLRLHQQQIHMLNTSDVFILQEFIPSPRAVAAKQAGGTYVRCFACRVKVLLHVAANILELPGNQGHLTMSKFTINVNLETAVRLHRLWL